MVFSALACASVYSCPSKQAGYPCLSLHGGKEQSDRECTIADFKGAVCNILVATSIAARGLDVRDLVLVVNYDVPNHHEDYVHRCVWGTCRVPVWVARWLGRWEGQVLAGCDWAASQPRG